MYRTVYNCTIRTTGGVAGVRWGRVGEVVGGRWQLARWHDAVVAELWRRVVVTRWQPTAARAVAVAGQRVGGDPEPTPALPSSGCVAARTVTRPTPHVTFSFYQIQFSQQSIRKINPTHAKNFEQKRFLLTLDLYNTQHKKVTSHTIPSKLNILFPR